MLYSIRPFPGTIFLSKSREFVWLVSYQCRCFTTPGYSSSKQQAKLYIGKTSFRFMIRLSMDGTDWYMIGLNEWVERRKIRQFVVNTTPPDGVDNGRWIEVNLYEQTLGIYENGKLVFATFNCQRHRTVLYTPGSIPDI